MVVAFVFAVPALAAITYGSTTLQASFAASTTKQIGGVINNLVSGDAGQVISTGDLSAVDTIGFFGGATRFFSSINTWLKEKAGIDFAAILTGIGHLFLVVIRFVVDILKKIL